MEKSIKDYLNLYTGCWGTLTRKKADFYFKNYENGSWCLSGSLYQEIMMYKHDFKLHLRPLSDMTEEESVEYNNIQLKCFSVSPFHDQCKSEASKTAYLLSKHFDLFNLHEAGLCLYKSDLK